MAKYASLRKSQASAMYNISECNGRKAGRTLSHQWEGHSGVCLHIFSQCLVPVSKQSLSLEVSLLASNLQDGSIALR